MKLVTNHCSPSQRCAAIQRAALSRPVSRPRWRQKQRLRKRSSRTSTTNSTPEPKKEREKDLLLPFYFLLELPVRWTPSRARPHFQFQFPHAADGILRSRFT